MDNRESIEKTKQGFETSFSTSVYYDKQTKDEKHLESILQFLQVKPGMRILDLGTGTGYLVFPIAENNKEVEVYDYTHDPLGIINSVEYLREFIKDVCSQA